MTDIFNNYNKILSFATDFHKSAQYQISQKSVKWELRWHEEGQTDITKLTGAIRDYEKVPVTKIVKL
jgi:hypothetical protein